MKTEVKPNTTEGKTDSPEIYHAYTTHLIVGDNRYEIPPPWLSLCKQKVRDRLTSPLPDDAIKCVVCLDLINKPDI